jgi:hypothetical protein
MLTVIFCVLSVVFTWGLYARSETAFSVQRVATAQTKSLPDGSRVQAWRAIIGNRGQVAEDFSLDLSPQPGVKMELLGLVRGIRIAPNENRQVGFFIRFNTVQSEHQPFELRLLKGGSMVATTRVMP